MATRKSRRRSKPAITYTLSQRQLRWFYLCVLLVDGVVIWLGLGLNPLLPASLVWRVSVAQMPLVMAFAVMGVLTFQWQRQARRHESLFRYVDAETGETFTPVGDEMEV